jgi:hypothetical protein
MSKLSVELRREQSRDALRRETRRRTESLVPETPASSSVQTEYDARLRRSASSSTSSCRYDQHPDVVATKHLREPEGPIVSARSTRAQAVRGKPAAPPGGANSTQQQIRSALAQSKPRSHAAGAGGGYASSPGPVAPGDTGSADQPKWRNSIGTMR